MFRPALDFHRLYTTFNNPVTEVDCGQKCAPFSTRGLPVCCDICEAIPCAYDQEWQYLQTNTDHWHLWQESDCQQEFSAEISDYQVLIACQGSADCQREYRSISCRQFPFFPYITRDSRTLGLTYFWEFEPSCWVISNLHLVLPVFKRQFLSFYDQLFDQWPEEMESYAYLSENMRAYFLSKKRRIPILHRNGKTYLLSPNSERLQKIEPEKLQKFEPFAD